jgi:hypothetical protein
MEDSPEPLESLDSESLSMFLLEGVVEFSMTAVVVVVVVVVCGSWERVYILWAGNWKVEDKSLSMIN